MKIVPMEVTLIDMMGTDLSVVNAARVSFHKASEWVYDEPYGWDGRLSDKDAKLIAYLAKHKHYSPFNHTFVSFRVKAPIFVARQLVKHEYMPWNEVSRRYVDEEPEFYMPILRERAENVKQGSSDVLMDVMWEQAAIEHLKKLLAYYNDAIEAGMAPEVARAFLPQNMVTEFIWSGTLKAFAKMLKLRLDSHAQQETREIAEKIKEQLMPHFPVSLAALLENDIE